MTAGITESKGAEPHENDAANNQKYVHLGAMHRRVYRLLARISVVGIILLVAIWAITEYVNEHGWPSSGVTLGTGSSGVWNLWIIYPILVWAALVALHRGLTRLSKPVTKEEEDKVNESIGE